MPTERYTHGHHESVLRSHVWRTVENSAAYLRPHLRAGLRLLDVGCGPATLTADLAGIVSPGEVVGIDNAPVVLEVARATLARRGATNASVEEADVYRLPFADAAFDVVHAHQVLQHLTEPLAALREMRRVCAPGGIVAARDGDYPAMAWFPEEPGMDSWMSTYLAVASANSAEPAAGRRLKSWARLAGFEEVEASASVWCFSSADDRAWWGGLWAERVEESAFATQARQGGYATKGDLAAMSAGWRSWAASEDGWFLAPHGEILCRLGGAP